MERTTKPVSFIEAVRSMNGTPNAPAQPSAPRTGQGPTLGFENAVIATECANVRAAGVGNRNRALNDAAFNLAQIMDPGMWESDLTQAALDAGLDLTEIGRTINSGVKGAAAKPRPAHRMPSGRPSGPVQDLPELGAYEDTTKGGESRRINWAELAADDHIQEWLCEPIIPAGGLIALYSPPKVGKSLLALDMAVAISRGQPVLGAQTTQAPVLYLDYENTRYDVRDRLLEMGNDDLRGLEHLHYESFPELPYLDTQQGGQQLLHMAQADNVRLVIIDTISRCISGDENDALTWLALYRNSLLPLKREGISVLRLDHTGKDETKGMRGSSAKYGDVDLVWRLATIEKDTTYELTCEAHRMQITEDRLVVTRNSEPLSHAVSTRTPGAAKIEAILNACDAAGLPLSAGRDQVRKVMADAGIKGRNALASEIVRRRKGLPPTT